MGRRTEHQERLKKPSKKKDLELEVSARAHYDDPAFYTDTYSTRIEDIAYYVDLALAHGKRLGRVPRVLEYGAGNGRISVPLARHGISVTCVDWSKPMLTDLKDRLRREPKEVRSRVKVVHGDMREVRLDQTFDLVFCPFNTALHLYVREDVEAFFAGVKSHLAPDGTFVSDLSVPLAEDLARDPSVAHRVPKFEYPGVGMVKYREYFDYDRARQVLFVAMEFSPVNAAHEEFSTPLSHRQFYPQEWEALLHYNGFTVTGLFGDFAAGPFDRQSDVMIWHAQVSRKKR